MPASTVNYVCYLGRVFRYTNKCEVARPLEGADGLPNHHTCNQSASLINKSYGMCLL